MSMNVRPGVSAVFGEKIPESGFISGRLNKLYIGVLFMFFVLFRILYWTIHRLSLNNILVNYDLFFVRSVSYCVVKG